MKIGTMKPIEKKDICKMLQFSHLGKCCNIFHFVTTRHGGVSEGAYASFNPGEYSGDDLSHVLQNRKILCKDTPLHEEHIYVPYQVHEAECIILDSDFLALSSEQQNQLLYGKDALITNVPNVCVGVTTADCVPVLVYAPDKKVIAAIHAGWRGTVKQIVSKTVQQMVELFHCNPNQLIAGIGPSISKEAFEVGEEVLNAFYDSGICMEGVWERSTKTNKPHIDLWEINKRQLIQAGLLPEHIELSEICTYENHTDFFSARRLGILSGRILSGIMIKP